MRPSRNFLKTFDVHVPGVGVGVAEQSGHPAGVNGFMNLNNIY